MCLSEAVDILKKDKEAVALVIALGNGNEKMEAYIEATDVVLEWVDKMYSALFKTGLKNEIYRKDAVVIDIDFKTLMNNYDDFHKEMDLCLDCHGEGFKRVPEQYRDYKNRIHYLDKKIKCKKCGGTGKYVN